MGPAMRYDPMIAPDATLWLAAPDADRLEAIRRYHKKEKLRGGRLELHAAIHAAVETQLAEGHPAAVAAMDRLIGEGLDRHEALASWVSSPRPRGGRASRSNLCRRCECNDVC